MQRFVFLLLLAVAGSASAVVIRDDVSDSRYRVAASEFAPLVDLPVEGHGVLIAPRWVVTAAHAVAWQHKVEVVVLNGVPRAVEQVIIHKGYKKLPQELIDSAMKSCDAVAIVKFFSASDDIALVKLAEPVTDVTPAKVFLASAAGKQVEIIGKGATGTGTAGHSPHGPNRTDLRRAFSTVSTSDGRWLSYVFRQAPDALPLEGSAGNGDSGGPLLVKVGNERQVAGLTSWKGSSDNRLISHPGKYGQINYGLRLAHYLDWINATMAAASVASGTASLPQGGANSQKPVPHRAD